MHPHKGHDPAYVCVRDLHGKGLPVVDRLGFDWITEITKQRNLEQQLAATWVATRAAGKPEADSSAAGH